MIARWVPAFIVRISFVAVVVTTGIGWQAVFADELQGVAKDFVGRWQAAPDLIYEFSAAGKFRILRDPSKQPPMESRWTLPANAVSCTVEGEFNSLDPKVNSTPVIGMRWIQQTIEQRSPDGKLERTTEKFPASQPGTRLFFLGKTDTPKRTITVTTSRPVTDREIALLIDVMEGELIKQAMEDKKESEKNTRTWERLGD